MQRIEDAGIHRHVGEDVLDGEVDRGPRGRDDAVHRPAARRARFRQVEGEVLPCLRDAQADAERCVVDAVGIDEGLALVDAVGDLRDFGPHLPGGTGPELGNHLLDDTVAITVDKLSEALLAHVQRSRLCLDVADALARHADIRHDDGEDLLVQLARLEEPHRRQAQPLLLDLGRPRRIASRHRAADIRPVSGVGKPGEQAPAVEERLHELDVHEVRAAEVGVVDGEDVAGLHRLGARDHRLRRLLHGAHEDRQAEIALGDELAGIAVIDAVGAILALGDDGAEGRPHEREVHLVADLLEAVLDHAEGDRVDRICRHGCLTSMTRLPMWSTSTACPGSITVVASSCSTIAGPMKRMPGTRASR